MADYFTKFSLVLTLKNESEKQYALDLAAKIKQIRFEEEPVLVDFPAPLKLVLEDWNFDTELAKEGVWLTSAEGGIDAVCAFIQHLLQQFDPSGSVGFEWSCDCSKPRTDAYGGGAAFITVTKIKHINTYGWLSKVKARHTINQNNHAKNHHCPPALTPV